MASVLSNLYNLFSKRSVPSFLIIGVQKSGTTTLYDILNRLPNFCGSIEKETGFFTQDKFYKQGPEWYSGQFRRCSRAAIKFEATPAYIYYPNVPKRILSFNEHMKFIVVLREPVARCYSAWNMFRRFNESGADSIFAQFVQNANPAEREAVRNLLFTEHYPSFKQAVIDDIERHVSQSIDIEPSFVRRGIYCEQIANYLQYFSLSRFLFLEQRELSLPVAVMKKISVFLSIEIDSNLVGVPVSLNTGDYPSVDAETEETMLLLRDFYRHHNEKLFSQIGVKYDWNEGAWLK